MSALFARPRCGVGVSLFVPAPGEDDGPGQADEPRPGEQVQRGQGAAQAVDLLADPAADIAQASAQRKKLDLGLPHDLLRRRRQVADALDAGFLDQPAHALLQPGDAPGRFRFLLLVLFLRRGEEPGDPGEGAPQPDPSCQTAGTDVYDLISSNLSILHPLPRCRWIRPVVADFRFRVSYFGTGFPATTARTPPLDQPVLPGIHFLSRGGDSSKPL